MARTISVKVPVASLIANIEAKIAEIDEAIKNYPNARKQYEDATEAYKAKVAKFVSDYVTNNVNQIGYDYDSTIRLSVRGNCVDLEFKTNAIPDFPESPEAPKQPNQHTYYGRDYTTPKSILEKNLKILKMTSQEEVNASTYGAILEIL